MKKLTCLIVFISLIFSMPASAQWATSSDGNCLYDVFGNLVTGSCQTDAKCKYKESGTTRRSCYGFSTPFGCFGIEYTEKLFVTECPLDDYIGVLTFLVGISGFLSLRKKSIRLNYVKIVCYT